MYTTGHDRDAFSRLGKQLSDIHSSQLSTQLSVFQSALINFANEHGEDIKQNLEFRSKFTELCSSVGLDPLELSIYTNSKDDKRNNNFYISLSVRIVEVCQETRDLNGGLISFKELLPQLQNNVNLHSKITDTDVTKALEVLARLGNGYEVLTIHGKNWLKFSLASTSSSGFTTDQRKVYEVCTFMGGQVSYRLLRDNYGWDKIRCKTVLDEMIMNGFLWVDNQGVNGELHFWEPSWISS
ncbi:ESCRT II complex subunit Dot2 [Yamadazyma tenuis]|uniref:Vacuolar-sorting protein SNF8 n=1 Tax=Candida tenuis (strain ATCC 10573 / BCRC 21748 / CBS 615 / JCM 9827 / NBRC 10315 / NRRL Y-1498 / VKM Y-70) TaxID=590646 RepID=G3BDS1_CANTC|nr:winged helix DNA-binding domain-containing protein [Yamadazyma tenuis ATCC 10573]EGV60365.1 winged helix DNA-binding domain-containing protein [Yamadazyma tenuis ATCC 10573]WEJ94389.1 ESCRT II complex subunit Dot2 [Yamadazyma tenuis]